MTFVGKILVIVIMAFALMFLGISTVVFTTATDWKKATETQKTKVSELTKSNADAVSREAALKAELKKAQDGYALAKKALDDRVAALTTDIERIQQENTAAQGEVVVAQQNAKTALEEADARRKETELLREQKLAVEKLADEYKLNKAELTDNIRIMKRELAVAKKNADDLRDKAARFSSLLRSHGLSDDISNLKGLESPPAVHGEVARVDQNKKVEITIGSDDGVVVGHEFMLMRLSPRPEYLGKIRITNVDPDQAVGVVIGTTVQGKKIKEGDIVSSTLINGPRS